MPLEKHSAKLLTQMFQKKMDSYCIMSEAVRNDRKADQHIILLVICHEWMQWPEHCSSGMLGLRLEGQRNNFLQSHTPPEIPHLLFMRRDEKQNVSTEDVKSVNLGHIIISHDRQRVPEFSE